MSNTLVSASAQGFEDGIRFVSCVEDLPSSITVIDLFRQISEAFRPEKHLLHPPPEELEASFRAGLSLVVILQDGKPIGHIRLTRLTGTDSPSGEWYELGGVWVHPDHRRHKLGARMHQRLKLAHKGKNFFPTSTNPLYVALVERLGYVKVPRMSLPPDVWRASCTCPAMKMGAAESSGCLLAWKEPQQSSKEPCFFMLEGDTAARLSFVSPA